MADDKTPHEAKTTSNDKKDEPSTFDALVTQFNYTPHTASLVVDFLDQLHAYIHSLTENRYYSETLGKKVVLLNDELEGLLLQAHQAEFEENRLRAHVKANLKHPTHPVPADAHASGKTLNARVNDLTLKANAMYRKVQDVNNDIQNQHNTKR